MAKKPLWDFIAFFLVGPNSGTLAQGPARHAFNGACWPRVGWEKEYHTGYESKSYKHTVPAQLAEAMGSDELFSTCRQVVGLLRPAETKLTIDKGKSDIFQVSMPL